LGSKNKKSNDRHYVNNGEFLQAMIDYKEVCRIAAEKGKPRPMIPRYIAECFLKMSQRLAFRPNFVNYPFVEEMTSDGIENCCLESSEMFMAFTTDDEHAADAGAIRDAVLFRQMRD